MATKVEVKNIDYVWHAFMPSGVLTSSGIVDIVDQVEAEWGPVPPDKILHWEVKGNKFVVREIDKPRGKLSKSDRDTTESD